MNEKQKMKKKKWAKEEEQWQNCYISLEDMICKDINLVI